MNEYVFVVSPLNEEDGGGFIVTFPDLPGCASDGETVEEAVVNAKDAFTSWMEVQIERDVYIPSPGEAFSEANKQFDRMAKVIDDQAEEIEQLKARLNNRNQATGRMWRSVGSVKVSSMAAYRPLHG